MCQRFIPAYAGNSSLIHSSLIDTTVHPRLRGELEPFFHQLDNLIGSSPLTRGTQKKGAKWETFRRFIPAYAGNSKEVFKKSLIFCGSSPLTRGTQIFRYREFLAGRFIPAYAGNSHAGSIYRAGVTVHPRLRGELLLKVSPWGYELRFIPAYAGNSKTAELNAIAQSVHPRLRGELAGND